MGGPTAPSCIGYFFLGPSTRLVEHATLWSSLVPCNMAAIFFPRSASSLYQGIGDTSGGVRPSEAAFLVRYQPHSATIDLVPSVQKKDKLTFDEMDSP